MRAISCARPIYHQNIVKRERYDDDDDTDDKCKSSTYKIKLWLFLANTE